MKNLSPPFQSLLIKNSKKVELFFSITKPWSFDKKNFGFTKTNVLYYVKVMSWIVSLPRQFSCY